MGSISKGEQSERTLFTWISGITAVFGIATAAYSIVNLNLNDSSVVAHDNSEASTSHVNSLVLHYVVAAFVGLVQSLFSILPLCKILCRSTWKWVNFVGGIIIVVNVIIFVVQHMGSHIEDIFYWSWLSIDGISMIVITLCLCCRDYRLNQSLDIARIHELDTA